MSDARRVLLRADRRIALKFAVCLLVGCAPVQTDRQQSGRIDGDPAASNEKREVQLVAVDRDGLDAAIASHRGQVVLVDFWATWCGPCVEQLPHTVDLANRLGGRGLAVVTVSLDDPDNSQRVGEFLGAQGAGVTANLISQFGASPQSMDAFDIPSGAVPHYKMYDRSGQLRYTFGVDPSAQRQFTQQDIDAAVEQLLTE